jgi:hypothetical protein
LDQSLLCTGKHSHSVFVIIDVNGLLVGAMDGLNDLCHRHVLLWSVGSLGWNTWIILSMIGGHSAVRPCRTSPTNTTPDTEQVHRHHYLTPYGLYNPYLEGTGERFRTYALTGSTLGLKKKKIYATNKSN